MDSSGDYGHEIIEQRRGVKCEGKQAGDLLALWKQGSDEIK